MPGTFQSILNGMAEYEEIEKALKGKKGPILIGGCIDAAKSHLISETGKESSWKLVVTYSEARAKMLYEDCRYFEKNVWLYPAKDLLFYNADIQGNVLVRQRMQVIKQLLEAKGGTVITTIDGCMDHLVPLHVIEENVLRISLETRIDIELLSQRLAQTGYERTAQAEEPGQFAIRGGIVDIFPLTEENPVRIELWDDEIDAIKSFDAESQRSIEELEEIRIYPAAEIILKEDVLKEGLARLKKEGKNAETAFRKAMKTEEGHRIKQTVEMVAEELNQGMGLRGLDSYICYFYPQTVSLVSYFPANSMLYLDEPGRLGERADTVETELRESMTHRLEKGYVLPGQVEVFDSVKTVFSRFQDGRCVVLAGIEQRCPYLKLSASFELTMKQTPSYQNHFEELIKDLKRWKRDKYRVVLLSGSRTRAERLAKDLQEYDLLSYYRPEADSGVGPGQVLVTYGKLNKGFEYPFIRFVVVTDGDMFGEEKKKRRKKHSYEGKKLNSFADLVPGDYVIHENHGLGIYRGIEKIEVNGNTRDYLKIEYGGNGNLYLPVNQMDLVQKYASADAAKKPKLNRLGGSEWKATKARVKGEVKEIAKDLVELYAARQKKKGFAYGKDTVWQREFEEMFPYTETDDQLSAIEAVKEDMESDKIMDRLICGDVGFGKTEVAIRAAFKAVQDEKQVVYLAPTTILAQQIYNTFVQRMSSYPVRIELLSRFRTPQQIKNSLAALERGTVDIIVGTHRVLSKDVVFKDLGLLIVDEEQRFGVAHKEKIKKLKENVDVITLTATPIPRTLHMSLVGIRDMSVLEEPPMDRVPIQTYVMEYNEEMIREAINRELARGGQIYYVYNRVKDIEDITSKIAGLVPDANVVYAHGQMSERQLERIMLDFVNGEIDVLVSTTIIETGLDISNVNTIIIHDADRLGLAQLYQLRGRVGRSNRTAYAFLMYKRDKILKEEAEKRLQAIREYTELGSGIRIAMRDLEIRGAGNILGARQHGHMEAVGYDLYCKLLNTAVRALKGEEEEETFDTVIDLDIDAYIPTYYIKNENQKMDIYKRIAGISGEEEHSDMIDELTDRFGDIPKPVDRLLKVALLRAKAHSAQVTEITGNRQSTRLSMYQKANVDPGKIPWLIKEYNGNLKFHAAEDPFFTYTDQRRQLKDMDAYLTFLFELMEKLEQLKA